MSPVLEERMLAAIGDAKTCPHGHPIQPGERIAGVPLADVEEGAKVRILRFENEAEELLHLFKAEGVEPGPRRASSRATTSTSSVDFGDATATLTRSVAETVSVIADPSPAAAHRAARAARARPRTATAARSPGVRARVDGARTRAPGALDLGDLARRDLRAGGRARPRRRRSCV